MKVGGVVETWQGFQRGTKRLFFAMLLLGVFLLAMGIAADCYKAAWMENNSFIPNILAGLTGFLIGVPVALVGVGTITGQREEKIATSRVQALTQVAWRQFSDNVRTFCDPTMVAEFLKNAEIAESAYNSAARHLLSLRGQVLAGECSGDDYEAARHLLWDDVRIWNSADSFMQSYFRESIEKSVKWNVICSQFDTLDQYVRLQRLERRLPWSSDTADGYLSEVMELVTEKRKTYLDLYYGPRFSGRAGTCNTVSEAFGSLEANYSNFDEVFNPWLLSLSADEYPNKLVNGLSEAAGGYALTLKQLRLIATAIEGHSKWPENFSEPESAD